MKISSKWIQEKGTWDNRLNQYKHIDFCEFEKELEMVIHTRDDKEILQFVGGPTGYESYYIEDLLRHVTVEEGKLHFDKKLGEQFCICGGTINRWPRCLVNWLTVLDFILKESKTAGKLLYEKV